MLNMIKMDLYRMFRTRSMYVIWLLLALFIFFMTALFSMDYGDMGKELETQGQTTEAQTTKEEMTEGQQDDKEGVKISIGVSKEAKEGRTSSRELFGDGGISVQNLFFLNTRAKFLALCLTIFFVLFSMADISSGYIKNIGGQVPKRGRLIFSRAVVLALFTFLSMAGVFLLQMAANRFWLGYLVLGDTKEILSYFLTELLLHWALGLICMTIAILLRNVVISMIITILFAGDTLSLIYGLLDKLVAKIGIEGFQTLRYTVTGRMSFLPMNPGFKECMESAAIAVVFIIVALFLSSTVFQKRDI